MTDLTIQIDEWQRRHRQDARCTCDLFAVALGDPESDEVEDAIRTLHFRGSRDVFDRAVGLCRSPCPLERRCGASVLSQLGIPARAFVDEALPILTELAATETNPDVLHMVCIALGHQDNDRAVASLVAVRGHFDAEVRFGVAFALGGYELEAAIAALIELSSDEDARVRDWATFGLAQLSRADTTEIREALWRRVNDPDDGPRGEALIGLAHRNDGRVVEPLLAELSRAQPLDAAREAAELLDDPRIVAARRTSL